MTRSRPRTLRALAHWLPVAAWMALIFRLSEIPGSQVPGRFSALGHFAVYAVLGALLTLALRENRTPGQTIVLAVFIAALYGVTDELHQSFVPMRTPDVADWGVDTLGAFAGAALSNLAVARHGRTKPS